MMRSMSSAVSGLKAQQTAMDVIGNNIANVNTNGFRASSTHFEDLFYQNMKGGSAETNPSEIGYGAQVADISKNMGGSGATTTDKTTDLYISGEGYYAVATNPSATAADYYTRVGNFHFDANGYLCDSNGNYVMAKDTTNNTYKPLCVVGKFLTTSSVSGGTTTYSSAKNTAGTAEPIGDTSPGSPQYSDLRDITFNADGSISCTWNSQSYTLTTQAAVTTDPSMQGKVQIAIANFVNEDGLTQVGNNYYQPSASSGAASISVAGGSSNTEIESGALESSNVDMASEFTTMITAQRGFQANSRVITTSDSLLEELINLKRS